MTSIAERTSADAPQREAARSPLHEAHLAAGAKLTAFAGFMMPLYYEGAALAVQREHLAVRERCGVFDVSHMGQVEISGPEALPLLQRVLSNDLARIEPGAGRSAAGTTGDSAAAAEPGEGRAQYSVICAEDGGVLDDLIAYRLAAGRYLLVTNAANHERDLAWIQAHAERYDASVQDRRADYAMLALQGPRARALLAGLAGGALPGRMRSADLCVSGIELLACGSGYTGEDGLELLCAPRDAVGLWDALVAAGAQPAGLAARDTLRIEACLPLYGNELTERRNPIEAQLGFCCAEQTGFIGAGAVAEARRQGPPELLVPFMLDGPGIARSGNLVRGGGVVTSGTLSPCLRRGVGMAYLPAALARPGRRFEIDVRGRLRSALVARRPLLGPQNAGDRSA